ncbi:hypothetical protein RINTHM_1400 [Richelia intracellularis HM01]|nr:hypothetical protein RINTHM_1400 [Richelia intracellularis HM01]
MILVDVLVNNSFIREPNSYFGIIHFLGYMIIQGKVKLPAGKFIPGV